MTLLKTLKYSLAKQRFVHLTSKKAFSLIQGETLQSLKRVIKDRIEFQESIYNAGLPKLGSSRTL